MKKLSKAARIVGLVILLSPLLLSWLPANVLSGGFEPAYRASLFLSFKQLSITLASTILFAATLTFVLGYLSVLSMSFGRGLASVLNAVESIPAILIALFLYAPAAVYLAGHVGNASTFTSLAVFIMAATLTALPEAVRGVAIPLGDLYNRKYSLSFRSYGFAKSRILFVLMRSSSMLNVLKRAVAGILLKTLVLDCSFGFIIQVGFGSYGTPAHTSPGALIAANRNALSEGGNPLLFWLPAVFLITISTAFLLLLNDKNEKEANA
jgi:hypothetical protein